MYARGAGMCPRDVYKRQTVLFADSDNILQLAVHRLSQLCDSYDLKISMQKSNHTMAYIGKDQVWIKIIILYLIAYILGLIILLSNAQSDSTFKLFVV